MSLHGSKKTALLQLCNCMSSCDLKNLEDLCDGDIFVDIIRTSFPDFVEAEQSKVIGNCNKSEEDDRKTEGVSETERVSETEVEHSGELKIDMAGTSIEVSDMEVGITTSCEITEGNPTHADSIGATEKMLHNYKLVQTFIDNKYFLQSEDIISYSACQEANELELSKVAFFILSEVVKNYVNLNGNQLSTLALLDARVQEDLEECFRLLILERESISKSSVEKILCHQAKYKSPSPVIRNSFITPRRSCNSKYRIDSPATSSTDDVFTNSPLKSFFESPVFKEELLRKDKEIAKTRNILFEEELKADNLASEVKDLKAKLIKKEDEIKKLKETVKEITQSEKVKDEDIKKLLEEKEESSKKFRATELELIRENSNLLARTNLLEKEVKDHWNSTCGSSNVVQEILMLRTERKSEKQKSKKLMEELTVVKEALKVKTKELNDVNAKLHSATFDLMKNESLLKEKLDDLKSEKKDEPSSPGSGEIIGSIIEEENKMLRLKLNTAEYKIKELEEKLEKIDMQLHKDCIASHPSARDLSMPDLEAISELPEIGSKNSYNKCDISSNSEDASNTSFNRCGILSHSQSNNSLNRCDTSMSYQDVEKKSPDTKQRWTEVPFADPTVELYGILWKNLNLNNEDGKDQELNGSGGKTTLASLTFCEFLNLLKISSMNVANGYNLGHIFGDKKSDANYLSSVLKSEKSKEKVSKLVKDLRVFKELLSCLFIFINSDWVKSHLENGHRKGNEESEYEKKLADYVILLKSKEKEIEKLESDCNVFEQQIEQCEARLEEKDKKMEELEVNRKRAEDLGKLYFSKYEKCKARVIAAMEMEKEHDFLSEKLKIVEFEAKQLKKVHDSLSERFQTSVARRDRQIQFLSRQVQDVRESNQKYQLIIRKLTTEVKKLTAEKDKYLLAVKKLEKVLQDKEFATISNSGKHIFRGNSDSDVEYFRELKKIKMEPGNCSYMSDSYFPQKIKMEPGNCSYMSDSYYPQKIKMEHGNCSYMSDSYFPDLNSTVSRDFNNESTSSSALPLCKNGLVGHFVSQDEESFFNQSSLEDIKKVPSDDRADELRRRNSLYPQHLQSSYPLEADLTPSADRNLYVKNEDVEHSNTTSEQEDTNTKKRKLSEVEETETQSNEMFQAKERFSRLKRLVQDSPSLNRILHSRKKRSGPIKPKP